MSPPLQTWRIFLKNLIFKLQEKEELPKSILADFLDDSLQLFTAYYGDGQPSFRRSTDFRIDLLAIVDLAAKFYAGEMAMSH
jgi:hypothetical protein